MKAENRQLREENDAHRTDEEPDRLAVLTGALETLREEVRQALVRNST